MFGYVLPLSDRLSEQAKAQYRAVYCGLCDCLRRRYGFRARFLVNYDMTFLYLLLRREESACGRCFCPLRPFCKKRCVRADAELEYAADLSVLLSLGVGAVAVLDFIHYCRATVCWEWKVMACMLPVLLPVTSAGPDKSRPHLDGVIFPV